MGVSSLMPVRAVRRVDVDAMRCQPVFDVGGVEAEECADLVEGDAAFVDEAADESFGDAESRGESGDVEHLVSIRCLMVASGCHAGHRES